MTGSEVGEPWGSGTLRGECLLQPLPGLQGEWPPALRRTSPKLGWGTQGPSSRKRQSARASAHEPLGVLEGRLGRQFQAPRRSPGPDRGRQRRHCTPLPSWGRQEAPGTSWAQPGPAQPGRSGWRSDEGAACRYMKNCTEIWGSTSRPNTRRRAGPAPGACSELLPSALPPCPAPCCWEGSAVASRPLFVPLAKPHSSAKSSTGVLLPQAASSDPSPTIWPSSPLQHPRGSPKWQCWGAGIWGH